MRRLKYGKASDLTFTNKEVKKWQDEEAFTLNVYGSANMQQKIKCMNLLNELL